MGRRRRRPALALADAFGNYARIPSGTQNCTWVQLPTNGGAATGGAPFSGRVTAVRVRSGANPAPLRFTVVRFISGLTPDGEVIPDSTQCCFGQVTSQTVAMTPNAVTTVGLNLPVLNEKRIKSEERVVISDFVGISATSNTGSLPVLVTSPQPNSSHYGQPGVPSVLLHYPEVTPGQIRTDGFSAPDHRLTMLFTMCTSGGRNGRATPAATFKVGGACGARVTTSSVTVRRGKVSLPVRCVGACSGTVKIVRAKGKGMLAKPQKFSVAPGKRGRIKLPLTSAGKKATAGRKSTRARIVITSQGTTTKRVVLLE